VDFCTMRNEPGSSPLVRARNAHRRLRRGVTSDCSKGTVGLEATLRLL
jgi:hypothetical protein